jgi:hypothetical protein
MTPEKDRRHAEVGRRMEDNNFCPVHFTLQDEKKDHRELVCGKIAEIKRNAAHEVEKLETENKIIHAKIDEINRNMIGKYWFRIIIGGLCAVMIYYGTQQNIHLERILINQKDFSVLLNNIENTQIKVVDKLAIYEKEIDLLNKRQDFLRDMNIKQHEKEK